MCNYLPMYLRDLGDDPSVGNLAFSTYLSGVKSATCQMVVKEAKLPSKALFSLDVKKQIGSAHQDSKGLYIVALV
jgi:hypothetical protein